MASDLETLHELQKIDLELLEKRREVEAHEAALTDRRNKIEAAATQLETHSVRRKKLISERAMADRLVSDRQDQLRERRQRINKVRNERELHMNEREVKDLDEEVSRDEEVLLNLMQQVEDTDAAIEGCKKEMAELEEADHVQVAEAQSRIDGLKAHLTEAKEGRDRLASGIEARMRRHYDNVLSKRGGQAVVEVRAGSCSGCYMRVPPQTLNEIRQTGAIRVCQSCQRILYVTVQLEEAET